MAVLSCSKDLATSLGITAPILLLTDNAALREHIHRGTLNGFVTTPHQASHVYYAQGKEPGRRALMTSFLDLALLSRARCLIGSPSGYSLAALIWGRHRCYLEIEQCMSLYNVSDWS
jgi:hypothetical protein